MTRLDKLVTALCSLGLAVLMGGALLLLTLILSGCAARAPQPVEPLTRVILPRSLDGAVLFCVEAPWLNDHLDDPVHTRTVCPWTVDEIRRLVARLQVAE